MNLRRTAAAAALVIGAMTVGAGTAYAEPAAAEAEPINYSVKLVDKTVVTTLKGGTFELTETEGATPEAPKVTVVDIKDSQGATVVSMPLEFDASGLDIPVKPVLAQDDTVLELTPERPEGFDPSKPVAAKPIASPIENQRAQNEFASKFGIGTAVGSFVGTALGAAIGCVASLPAGCVPGLVAGAGIGGILGTIIVGGPALVIAGIELANTVMAADGTTQWADKPKPADQPN